MIGNKNSNGIAVFGNPLLFIADKLEFNTLLLLQKCVGAQDWELRAAGAMRFLRDIPQRACAPLVYK